MTETAIRRAIAKACGIEDAHWCADGLLGSKFVGWVGPDDNTGRSVNVPDYPRSLDAMHEAVDHMNKTQPDNWNDEYFLMGLCGLTNGFPHRATADQWAGCFLRTLNLWEE